MSGTGLHYNENIPMVGVSHVGFDGVNGIKVSRYTSSYAGQVYTYTGTGTYTIDAWCRGTGKITTYQNGVAGATTSFSFVVSGTPTNPEISAITWVGAPASFTGTATFKKIGL